MSNEQERTVPFPELRIGYAGGSPVRVNERVIDSQWVQYLGEYAELVKIPSFSFFKLFGGTIDNWIKRFPDSLLELAQNLDKLCKRYRIRSLYLNVPFIMPYLLMARSYAGVDLGFLIIAHSVGSEFWIRKWIGCAPWLSERDVLLCSTESSKQALMRISENYSLAQLVPLCIARKNGDAFANRPVSGQSKHILAIGRIEEVKNIHVLLNGFSLVCCQIPDVRLTIAGEYTGQADGQKQAYKQLLETMIVKLGLQNKVSFVGVVEGEVKDELFRKSDLLVNLSTDPGETFGFNLIEAKVWGLPVVCTSWDGFQEVVRHGEDGFLVDCDWEQDEPCIRIDQFAAYTVRLLTDDRLRKQVSSSALEAAKLYDYKQISPLIASAIIDSLGEFVSTQSNAAALASSALADLAHSFHVENLEQFSFADQSLLKVMSDIGEEPLNDWMRQVKPIIGHYAKCTCKPSYWG